MGYINFQLQNNSFSIIFQASGKKKSTTCYLHYVFLTEKQKHISKQGLRKAYQEILQKNVCKGFQLIGYLFAFI